MTRRFLLWLDDRLGSAAFVRGALRKAFPDHWSFMLGEINLYAFGVLVATGTFLAFFFQPSAAPTVYHGPYALLDGSSVSRAYASVLAISFEVNGGLLVRQIHHWAALVFLAGIVAHLCRIFFTGAFRKPREINWAIGVMLLGLALLAGFSGYSLPDDLLSGIGLRIADAVALSIPIVGSWMSSLLLGGVFPTERVIPRLFVAHVFLLPAAIGGAIALHLAVLWRQKHTQFPGPGRTERNVVGSPMVPQYAAKSLGLMFATVAVLCGLGALVQINPVWLWGPYEPWQATNPAQPDWYVGWIEGALRIGPPLALHLWGHTVPSPFWPAVVLPGALFALLFFYPWIEAVLRNDRRAHQLLERPRDVPLRTGLGCAMLVFTGGLLLAGSDDVQARYLHEPLPVMVSFYRIFCIVAPVVAFAIAAGVAHELRARGGVHEARRVRLYRSESGGFDEETVS